MKRRIYQKILAAVLGLSMIVLAAGCSKNNIKDADKTMDAFYQLIIYQDTKSMTELGIDRSESKESLKTYQSSMISTIQTSFKNAGVSISKTQSQQIFEAISKKLAALDYKVEIVKDDDKEASVKVSSQYINYLDLFREAKNTTLNELKPLHIESLSGAKKQLVANVIETFENAKVSEDMHSKTFLLKQQKIKSGDQTIRIFFPEDYDQIGIQLIQIATNQ